MAVDTNIEAAPNSSQNDILAATGAKYVTSKLERFSYGSYVFGQNLLYFLIVNFLMLYLTDSVGIAAGVVGTIFFITKLWDAVNDPLIGMVIDRTNPKHGKFKPWIDAVIFLMPVSTLLVFLNPKVSPVVNIAFAFIAYVLWDLIYTISDAPVYALSTVMTNNLNERVSLLSLTRFTGMIGILVVAVAGMPLISAVGWQWTAVIICGTALLTMLPLKFTAKERIKHEREEQITVKQMVQFITSNKYLMVFYGAFILSSLLNTAQAANNYFAIYVLGDPNYVSMLSFATLLPMMLIPLILPGLIKKFGKKPILLWAMAFNILVSIIYYFVGYQNINLVMLFSLLKGVGMAPFIMISMFTTDLIEYGHYKTGQRAEAVAFSIQTFATKLQGSVTGLVGGWMLTWIGYQANTAQTPQAIQGLWNMTALYPIFSSIILVILIGLFYNLKESDVERMVAEIRQREEAKSARTM